MYKTSIKVCIKVDYLEEWTQELRSLLIKLNKETLLLYNKGYYVLHI
jgi:hypothetical protein